MEKPVTAAQEKPVASARRGGASRVVEQLTNRSGQLVDFGFAKAAEFAETRKSGVVEKIDAAADIVGDLADAAGERFGRGVGDVVQRGVDALGSVSRKLDGQSVEDLVGTARTTIVRYPTVALAAVTVVGFLVGRIAKAGLQQSSHGRSYRSGINTVEAAA